jgi:hypothetical protein
MLKVKDDGKSRDGGPSVNKELVVDASAPAFFRYRLPAAPSLTFVSTIPAMRYV